MKIKPIRLMYYFSLIFIMVQFLKKFNGKGKEGIIS